MPEINKIDPLLPYNHCGIVIKTNEHYDFHNESSPCDGIITGNYSGIYSEEFPEVSTGIGADSTYFGTLSAMDSGVPGQNNDDQFYIVSGLMEGARFELAGGSWDYVAQAGCPIITGDSVSVNWPISLADITAIGTRMSGSETYSFTAHDLNNAGANADFIIDSAGILTELPT